MVEECNKQNNYKKIINKRRGAIKVTTKEPSYIM
jgi:hypothetical protein